MVEFKYLSVYYMLGIFLDARDRTTNKIEKVPNPKNLYWKKIDYTSAYLIWILRGFNK